MKCWLDTCVCVCVCVLHTHVGSLKLSCSKLFESPGMKAFESVTQWRHLKSVRNQSRSFCL